MPLDTEGLIIPKRGQATAQPAAPSEPLDTEGLTLPQNKAREDAAVKAWHRRRDAYKDALLDPFLSHMLREASFGQSDKLIAKFRDGDYQDNLDKEFAARDEFNADTPEWMRFVTGLGAGIPAAGGVIKLGGKAIRELAPSAYKLYKAKYGFTPKVARLGTDLTVGAGMGATHAAGQSNTGNEGEAAEDGALMGAGLTAVMKGVFGAAGKTIDLAKPAIQNIAKFLKITDPNEWAIKNAIQRLLEDGHEPHDIVAALRHAKGLDLGVPEAASKDVRVLDVAGPNFFNTIKSAIGKGGKGQARAVNELGDRVAGTRSRLANDVSEHISPNTSYMDSLDSIVSDFKGRAGPLYDQALGHGTVFDRKVLDWFNQNNERVRMLADRVKNRRDIGKPMDFSFDLSPDGTRIVRVNHWPSVKDLHEMKMDLDSSRNNLWNSTEHEYRGKARYGANDYNATELGEERNSLIKLIEDITPDGNGGSSYAAARKIFADGSDTRDALKNGYQIIKKHPDRVEDEFGKLTNEADRAAYRSGVASALTDLIHGNGTEKTLLSKIYGNDAIRLKLNKVLPDEQTKMLFSNAMRTEKTMVERTRDVLPGAQTQRLMESGTGDFSLILSALNASQGRFGAAGTQLASAVRGGTDRMAGPFAESMSDIGLMKLPEFETLATKADDAAGSVYNVGKRWMGPKIKGALSMLPYATGSYTAGALTDPRSSVSGAVDTARRLTGISSLETEPSDFDVNPAKFNWGY